ncbi:MAG: hypothetical protein ACRD1Z_04345, partial [Vicinamibacteria bacterium]
MSPSRVRSILGNFTLLLVSLILMALLFEGALRLFHPQDTRVKAPPGLYKASARYKRLLTPGFHGTFRRSDFEMEIRVNSLGLRDSEPPESKPKFRAIGLGDSFTFGW